ncbi:ComGF family competence protein [Lentibacillus sp. L22]|uniref:ComGF family competence protein n=1 Tax=Lentibacillus TaxID=175304 RepID=UPI0022B0C015|nr:ComGF family competence protein [Lentibacillus daqui]
MLKQNKRLSAYMAIRRNKNKNGFTFITLLVTITILFTTLPFTAYFLQSIDPYSHDQERAIQQFFYFLRDDVLQATDYAVTPTKLTLKDKNQTTITIEQYQNLIRRQVKGKGHEIYLREVKKVLFEKLPYGIKVSITSAQGETYEKSIMFYQ